MSTTLHGWVEVNTIKFSTESLWFSVFDIGIIVSQKYRIYGPLFGVRNEDGMESVAPKRGIPFDASPTVKDELVGESMVNQTWISFIEYSNIIRKIKLDKGDWGWKFVNEVMKELSKHYSEENIRIVVAFDNYG